MRQQAVKIFFAEFMGIKPGNYFYYNDNIG
jgi:hypothetical protein